LSSKASNDRFRPRTVAPPGTEPEPGPIHYGLRGFGIPVAVISNASLLWQATVRAELALADWVSLKIDSALPRTWRRINRPNKRLRLDAIIKGIGAFADQFEGKLVTETMLIDGVNENNASLESVAALLAEIQPAVAYIAAPTRPPAEPWVRPPATEALNRAFHLFKDQVERAEFLINYEGDAQAISSDIARELLEITAVHPLRASAVRGFLTKSGASQSIVDDLVDCGLLSSETFAGHRYYVRRFYK
jgi:wyosine [tRNA(Phe)-imidazoG37] synthetase (radical SAM superfamily)